MKIYHIIKTVSYDKDGRLQKWVDSLSTFGNHSVVHILEDKNESGEVFSKSKKVKKIKLLSRKIFGKRKGYLLKIPEYGVRTISFILKESPSVIVFHDVQQYLNILLTILFVKPFRKSGLKVIWDMHELPHSFLGKSLLTRRILRYILSRSDLLVYTNSERREYTLSIFKHKERDYLILNNYPSEDFVFSKKKNIKEKVSSWLENKPYVLWLGIAGVGRNFGSFLSSYQKISEEYKLIILGRVEGTFMDEIEKLKKEGKVLVNFVPQLELINYIDNAKFSVVLYKSIIPNNELCEPNRLYQLLTRNIPVICGNNKTMASVIKKESECTILLPDDGSSSEFMDFAFSKMIKNFDSCRQDIGVNLYKDLCWESQFNEVFSEKIKR